MRVVILGGGGTGGALAFDLAQRGLEVVLLERSELTSGTTGRHHGQLHCGARYAVGDADIARECMEESLILRRITPEAIEFNQGLFIGLTGEDEEYLDPFLHGCAAAGIPTEVLNPEQARAIEPALSKDVRVAVQVPDGTFDAFRLPLHFFAGAKSLGADIRTFAEVTGLINRNGRVTGVRYRDLRTGRDLEVDADFVVNTGGAWAGQLAAMAGIDLPVTPSPGTLLAVKGRLVNMVISRLHPPGDGDILVPQRGLSIIGTTQWIAESPEESAARREDIPFLMASAAEMVPAFADAEFHAAWSASRPLAGRGGDGNEVRGLSRDFECVDHNKDDGVGGFMSVIGGKATVLRAMAEAVADKVCEQLGVAAGCRTAESPLPHYRHYFQEQQS